jgi:hypothetical protein
MRHGATLQLLDAFAQYAGLLYPPSEVYHLHAYRHTGKHSLISRMSG